MRLYKKTFNKTILEYKLFDVQKIKWKNGF